MTKSTISPAVREALTRGRDAIRNMGAAPTDEAYMEAAATLADAFQTIDKLLTRGE